MLQRKNGLIHGSWISVTSSAMRIVSYQSRAPTTSGAAMAQSSSGMMSSGLQCSSTRSPTASGLATGT